MERNVDDVMSLDERYELMYTKGITLNGKPATISGAKLLFPTVAALDGSCNATWNWTSIKHIITNSGACFYTSDEARAEAKQAAKRAAKPTKATSKRQALEAPALDFTAAQLRLLIGAADESIKLHREQLLQHGLLEPTYDLLTSSIDKLQAAIRQMQAQLNAKEKFH